MRRHQFTSKEKKLALRHWPPTPCAACNWNEKRQRDDWESQGCTSEHIQTAFLDSPKESFVSGGGSGLRHGRICYARMLTAAARLFSITSRIPLHFSSRRFCVCKRCQSATGPLMKPIIHTNLGANSRHTQRAVIISEWELQFVCSKRAMIRQPIWHTWNAIKMCFLYTNINVAPSLGLRSLTFFAFVRRWSKSKSDRRI